jgi:hypothetical protein
MSIGVIAEFVCRWCLTPHNSTAKFCTACEKKLQRIEARGSRRECYLRLRCTCAHGLCQLVWSR